MSESRLYRVYLIPSSVFLSVVFGGSYGSGREVVEYVSRFGPAGGFIAMAAIVMGYGILLGASFELARIFRAYEYDAFFRVLLGRAAFLYEVVIIAAMILVLAVVAAAAGTIVEDHFGAPALLGSSTMLFAVVALTYYGRTIVQRSMVISVTALAIFLVILFVWSCLENGEAMRGAFRRGGGESGAFLGGLTYAVANGGFIPLLLYCARGLQTRGECISASLAAGTVAVVPALVFHVLFMVGFPEIIEERLPAYWIVETLTNEGLVSFYVLILFVLVCQTGVGLLQGLLERVEAISIRVRDEPLTPVMHGALSGGAVILSVIFAEIGIVALIAAGYSILSVAFTVVFVFPLLTRGIYRIVKIDGD